MVVRFLLFFLWRLAVLTLGEYSCVQQSFWDLAQVFANRRGTRQDRSPLIQMWPWPGLAPAKPLTLGWRDLTFSVLEMT